ncbi:MAG: RNA polymerase-binding protein DksA [Gammaproteobacteria bacterium]
MKKPAKSTSKPAASKASKPPAKAAAKPAAKPAPKPAAKPAAKPPAKPAAKPAPKAGPAPAAKAAAKPAARPAPKPAESVAASPAGKPARKGSSEFKNFTPYIPKKGEEYMNEGQKNHFRAILRTWRSELMQEVDRTVSHMKDEAANFPDPADRATQEEEFSLELRTRDRERKLIKKIESTLELIDQDNYGFCDACGVEIGIKRLEARPTATLCIDCKTLEEIKERQEHG